jgi:uncharacterized membrane protein
VALTETRPDFARREVTAVAGLVGLVLLAFSGRYGYHRDELYFLEAGKHLAWGYPDQPPLVPLIARVMQAISPDSLVLLRLPSTLAATGVVLLAGAMARDLGARRGGQVLAAAATGLCGFVLATGHLLSTATFSLLGWTTMTAILVKVLQGGRPRLWLLLGVVAGVTLQANVLALALVGALGLAIVLVGPRDLFGRVGPYLAVALAGILVAPYLVWQARNGWPQIDVGRSIAAGGSGSSQSRWAFLPFQFLQAGPWLAPLWLTGLRRLFRDETLRCLAVTYAVLAVVFVIGGGKPYYLSGLYPLLFAAGSQRYLDAARRWVVPVLLAASTPVLLIVLPVLPAHDEGPIVAINYDAGETIGWPSYVDQIAAAYHRLPPGTAILTDNYGEAGAIDHYGPQRGLPSAHSGHNAYGDWGPPPGSAPVLAIGLDPALLRASCTEERPLGTLKDPTGIDNDENGTTLVFCSGPVRPWAGLWHRFRHLG